MAASGTLNFEVHWNNQPFALDWAKVSDVLPPVEVAVESGNNQRGVIGSPVEQPLAVRLTSPDPTFPLGGRPVTFEIVAYPNQSSGFGVGADENATATTYTALADANGIAHMRNDGASLCLNLRRSKASVELDAREVTPLAWNSEVVATLRSGTLCTSITTRIVAG